MSGKKPAPGSISWVTCPKCRKAFVSRSHLAKHTENNCAGGTFPYFDKTTGELVLQLCIPLAGGQFPPQRLNSTSRLISDQIYIQEPMIKEANIQCLEWVELTPHYENDMERSEPPIPPQVLQVWPIAEEFTNTSNYKGILSSDGFLKNIQLQPNQVYKINKIGPENLILPAAQIELEIDGKWDDELDKNRVVTTFRRHFHLKPLRIGNQFRIVYYTDFLVIKIKSISPGTFPYSKLMSGTEIDVSWSQKDEPDVEDVPSEPMMLLSEIGGLDYEIREITSTINYILKPGSRTMMVPKGILLYGHPGTGKTITVDAICHELNLQKIVINDPHGPVSSLKEKFDEALKLPRAAIIIENLDVIGTKMSRSDPLSTFPYQFRTCVERISKENTCNIVILGTASKTDSIDPILRSPQIFGKEIEIPVPGAPQRFDILEKILAKVDDTHNLNKEEIMEVAKLTHGFTGADLRQLCHEGILVAKEEKLTASILIHCTNLVRPSAIKSILIDVPDVKWEDIGGMHQLKYQLIQSIKWPIDHPEAFHRFAISPPKGILMFGPPGCSKTMIAKAMATESGLNFLSVKGSELYSKWVGESEKAVQNLFRKARQVAPCILFFDELDAIGGARGIGGGGSSGVHERVLAQLLVEIDGIDQLKDVTIVGATNRPDLIDQALSRPGRLDRLVYVPLPDAEARNEIFKIRLEKMPVEEDINIDDLVKFTEGYSGAEIIAVCQEAALKVIERDMVTGKLSDEDLINGIKAVPKRTPPDLITFYSNFCTDFIEKKRH